MRLPGSASALGFGLLVFLAACRGGNLNAVTGTLVFSSPDQPAELTQPDAGLVQIAFGQVTVGDTKTLMLDFASIGSTVTIGTLTAIQPDAEFALPFVSGTLVQAAPSQITIDFAPSSGGAKSAQYRLDDASGAYSVLFELSGEGLVKGLSAAPNPLDFGAVEVNQSQSLPLTITNNGPVMESLMLSSLQGQAPGSFTLGTPSQLSLAPGGSATLNIAFKPFEPGGAGASFWLSGGPGSAPVTVDLGGTGVASWIQVGSPLDFGFVPLGNAVVKSVAVKNVSQLTLLHLVAPAPLVTQSGADAFMLGAAVVIPSEIPPGQSVEIPVVFTPLGLEEFTGSLSFTTDDPLAAHPTVSLQGYGGGPHISCLPQLVFGPVPVGYAVSRDTVCSNVGVAIPSHPELALQIAQNGLATDDSAFIPHLLLPDGGLAGSGDSVSLFSGQQATIQVDARPTDAGVVEGRLSVASNDIEDLDAGTLLTAQGILPGSCSLSVAPEELGFGEVPPGSIGTLEFEVSNTGQNLCVVSQVSLDPGSDPAFSVLGASGAQILSFPGNADNPAGLPSSLLLAAEFAPTTAEVAAVGRVDITAVDGMPAEQSIALTGFSQAACLSIQPSNLDFGSLGFSATRQQLCSAASMSFTATNGCATPVTVSQIALQSGLGAPAQFALQDSLQLPLAMAPGDQVSVQASFVPTSAGPKLGAITIESSEFPNEPFLITLQGDAVLPVARNDTFTVPALTKKVDLLWILDNDDDTAEMRVLAAVLPQLIASMTGEQLDYQIAVTSTDTCDAGMSDRGAFEPCDHCVTSGSADAMFVTPATVDPATTLVNVFDTFDVAPQLGLCEGLNGDEHFFDAIADAFSPALLSGHNSGFIREGAYLAIVLVNGDAEDDAAGGGRIKGPYLTSLSDVLTLVQGLKTDPAMVSVSYINSDAGTLNVGQKIGQLVQDTGGIEIDTTAPAATWQAALLDLFSFTEGVGAFHLSATPGSSSQIQVEENGVPVGDWSYNPYANTIVFNPGMLPAEGTIVTVSYSVGCP